MKALLQQDSGVNRSVLSAIGLVSQPSLSKDTNNRHLQFDHLIGYQLQSNSDILVAVITEKGQLISHLLK